jgi:hypothetical protein
MIKSITFAPAFDKRDPNPSKNYGIHGVDLRMLFGDEDKGIIQFVVYTNWHLPEVTKELASRYYKPSGGDPHWMERPLPADIGYHSPTPRYDGQSKMNTCDCLKQGFCYYDGSSLAATDVFNILLREGSDGVWKELENRYNEMFNS